MFLFITIVIISLIAGSIIAYHESYDKVPAFMASSFFICMALLILGAIWTGVMFDHLSYQTVVNTDIVSSGSTAVTTDSVNGEWSFIYHQRVDGSVSIVTRPVSNVNVHYIDAGQTPYVSDIVTCLNGWAIGGCSTHHDYIIYVQRSAITTGLPN